GYPGPWDRSECPIHSTTWNILVVDECHKVKNNKALRSRAVKAIKAKQRLYLTGTPIVNRPVELWPIVSVLDPATFSDFFPFALRYCNARKNSYGKWDFGGASNLDELQDKLRASIMVRRLKKDVLSELPPKRRQVIEIPVNGSSKIVEAENKASAASEERLATLKVAVELAKASEDPEDYAEAVKALRKGWMVAFTEMAKVRHDTAVAKIPFVIDHLNSVLEAGNKVVVFAHHHDVLARADRGRAVGGVPRVERRIVYDHVGVARANELYLVGDRPIARVVGTPGEDHLAAGVERVGPQRDPAFGVDVVGSFVEQFGFLVADHLGR
ncbi:hypothetical protein LCGC14_2894960, partial [marine sediment metagenome]